MPESPPLRLGIIAATFSGNRGAEAMLTVCIEQTRRRYPTAECHVLTYSPKADAAWCREHRPPGVFLHSCTPATLLLAWLPGGILCRLFPVLRASLRPRDGQGIRNLLELDGVVDLAGVAFMDGREKFLPFNVLTLLPFLLNRVPVVKLSQALGPITSWLNRCCAGWVLPRLTYLASRGRQTSRFLEDFKLPAAKWNYAPDTAFLLELPAPPTAMDARNGIVFMPSSLMAKGRPGYVDLLVGTARVLRSRGFAVHLLAHSWKEGTDKPRNNDYPLCQHIHAALGSPADMHLYGPGLDARALKTALSGHRIAVTSRFHGMIAALDTATPVWVLGWSHKYREVLAEFSVEDCALKTETLDAERLAAIVAAGYAEATVRSERIAARLGQVRAESLGQFDRLFQLLRPHD